jgi:hypothetical protein
VFNPSTHVKVLITARTYPIPATKGIEVSCTGGITEDGQWIRLFPVPWRFLEDDKRFRKYQWIAARVTKASDFRRESFYLDPTSIQIISDPLPTDNGWQARKAIVEPLESPSLCWLESQRSQYQFPTLGFFKPREITRLVIESDRAEWTPSERAKLQQTTMFGRMPANQLEKIPFKFSYKFRCDAAACGGHTLMCSDWEMGQSYRKWAKSYPDWRVPFLNKYEYEMIERFDTHFFVGTIHKHPNRWIVVGLFYPPRDTQRVEIESPQLALW